MLIEDLRYELQPESVTGTPREVRFGQRDLGRMLIVDRAKGSIDESRVRNMAEWLAPGDVVILNNSKRIPGVLPARTAKGGLVELRFVELADDGGALCKIFPVHDVAAGDRLLTLRGHGVDVLEMGISKYGLTRVAGREISVRKLLVDEGEPIFSFFYDAKWKLDTFNPFYAEVEGSVESPLAGLHFTPAIVDALHDRGVATHFVTLHSVGSWLPFLEDDIGDHEMLAEAFAVSAGTADAVNAARARGNRVIACGSTAIRALESAADIDGQVRPTSGRTTFYATPGYVFRSVSGYFTNFHQYQTSLMVLDAAFAGVNLVKRSYQYAADRRYAFFEFGDAVLYL